MGKSTQRKRRRRGRESSSKSTSSSDSEGLSDDDRGESEEHDRRWQTRPAHENKGKGKELANDEASRSSDESEDAVAKEEQQPPMDSPRVALDEICGICLSEGGNERGKLDCCEHFFCFGCIMEWAKVESRCPMCKQRFFFVTRPAVPGASRSRTRSFRIPTRDQVYEPSEEEIRLFTDPYQNTVCTECQEAGDEGLLLLCDRCDGAAHTYCVGLGRSVPRGDWFCQACQTLEVLSSGEEDDDDITFETTDVDEEGGSGTESILAALVSDVRPNLFAGRTRHSAAVQPLRRSSRRRVRRTSSDSPTVTDGLVTTSTTVRRGFSPLMEPYGAARTLSRQRQVQASVQSRLQNMRENWSRYQSGEVQFSSASHGARSSRLVAGEATAFPSSSTPRLGNGARSGTATSMDVDGGAAAISIQSRGDSKSGEEDLEKAWTMLERARRLEGSSAGASESGSVARASLATGRKNRETRLHETPVSARVRERHSQMDVSAATNILRSMGDQRHSQGEVTLRISSRGTLDESGSRDGNSRTNIGGVDVFLNTRSSNSRDNDIRESNSRDVIVKDDQRPESSHREFSLGQSDNSRGGYHLREGNRSHTFSSFFNSKENSAGGKIRSSTIRESRNDASEVLQLRSIFDDKDNSRGSGGRASRRGLLDDKNNSRGSAGFSWSREAPSQGAFDDNSRGSVGVTTRKREHLGKSILDDKDNSRNSTGPITRRESERNQCQHGSQRIEQSASRSSYRDEEVKLMKEQCNELVQCVLKPILNKGKIDKQEFKDIARSATHTILSSAGVSGLKHGASTISLGTVACDHEELTSSRLMPGCCNSCVQRCVTRVVKSLVKEKIRLHN